MRGPSSAAGVADAVLRVSLALFAGRLLLALAAHPRMFAGRYGRAHRLLGLLMLLVLAAGFADALVPTVSLLSQRWAYDAALSLLGYAVATSAARDFRDAHRRVRNEASGTLDEAATVTVSEMLEHSFYQLLNLVQVTFLHASPRAGGERRRLLLAALATTPWLARGAFPVNRFSDNYSRAGLGGKTGLIRALYRLKAYQYLLYKHFLLHGLNATVAVDGLRLGEDAAFRAYWLCLNASYVMEFFLQSLVKRGHLRQASMLAMQQALMIASTIAAFRVLAGVRAGPALLSLVLNLTRRGAELSNFGVVLAAAVCEKRLAGAGSQLGPMLSAYRGADP